MTISHFATLPHMLPEAIVRLSQPDEPLLSAMHLTGWILSVQFALLRRVHTILEEGVPSTASLLQLDATDLCHPASFFS